MLSSSLKNALHLQQLHLILSAGWNLAGVWLLSQGMAAPGPTASLFGALVMLLLCGFLQVSSHRWPLLYTGVSLLLATASAATIYAALTKDPALWPSEFWRLAGIVLNCLGVTGALRGSYICATHKFKIMPTS